MVPGASSSQGRIRSHRHSPFAEACAGPVAPVFSICPYFFATRQKRRQTAVTENRSYACIKDDCEMIGAAFEAAAGGPQFAVRVCMLSGCTPLCVCIAFIFGFPRLLEAAARAATAKSMPSVVERLIQRNSNVTRIYVSKIEFFIHLMRIISFLGLAVIFYTPLDGNWFNQPVGGCGTRTGRSIAGASSFGTGIGSTAYTSRWSR